MPQPQMQYAPPQMPYPPQYAPPQMPYPQMPSPAQSAPAGPAGQPPYSPANTAPAFPGAAPMNITASQPEKQKFQTEEDLILRESPNLAPYNWDMLPISSPLLHFRRMLNSAKKAESQRNYLKAIGIYQAVMQQKTIQENVLARNILKDQLEALDRLARSQISLNPKRKDIERYFGQSKKDAEREGRE
jgi:hypothetical protein